MNSQKTISIVSVVVLLLAIGAIFWTFQGRILPTPSPMVSPTPISTDIIESFSPTPYPSGSLLPESRGIRWYSHPVLMDNLKLIGTFSWEVEPPTYPRGDEYFLLGLDQGMKILLARVPSEGPGVPSIAVFRERSGGKYDLLTRHSDPIFTDAQYRPAYPSSVTLNNSFTYPEILFDDPWNYGGVTMRELAFSSILFSESEASMKKIADLSDGKVLYQSIIPSTDTGHSALSYTVASINGLAISYGPTYPFFTDDRVLQATWADGSKNTDSYRTDGYLTCGGFGRVAIATPGTVNTTKDLKVAGTLSTGEIVYEFVSAQHPLVSALFKTFGGTTYDYTTNPPSTRQISQDEYWRHRGVLVYVDKLGNQVLLTNTVYGPQAECGKPVIYLYPTKPTQVSVKVGAHVTVSEPAYNGGWNVLAEPTGKQTLFWEGIGHGPYPDIRQGFVVKQADLEATLWDHLARLGLNDREAKEFMEFWLPKMPTTPYVRLTWFGTQQMNVLAPLAITPSPDTMIRIFLDFEGLEKPISIPAQRLASIPRKGFTLIEWGGLLKK